MRRVVKVGGSLLDRCDLTSVLPQWVEKQERGETLIVVGGGSIVDAVRAYDAMRPGDPVETHWTCVELLDITFRLMSDWLDWPTVSTRAQLQQGLAAGFDLDVPTLVSVRSFYSRDRHDDPIASKLPRSWETTSDSIAALLTSQTFSDELVILKSCRIDPILSLDELASQGIVDKAFPSIAKQITNVRIETL